MASRVSLTAMIKRYPLDYNPIREYWNAIESGQEVVSEKVYKTYKKLVYDLDHEDESEFFYSPKRGNHVIEFIENFCRHSKGKMGGKPVFLELWEKAMLAAIFGFIDIEGNRKYREALLIVGRKNGKSLIASAVGLYMLTADGEAGPEVISAATKREQAKIIWMEAKRMVAKSPSLSKRTRSLVGEIDADFCDGVFKPLASDSNTLDGLNLHCCLLDEIHAWQSGKALYDVIADAITAREQPLIFITTTAGTVREDIYDQKYDEAKRVIDGYFDPNGYRDDRMIAFVYELDKRSEWQDPKCWKKANPGLGTIKNEGILRDKVEKAKQNPLLVKNLVCKEFNVPETTAEAWLTAEQVINPTKFDITELKPRYGIGGTDLSSTTDLTAAKVIFRVPDDPHVYVLQMYWMPEDNVEKRVREDHIPYDVWIEQGLMRTCKGNQISYHDVTEWFLEVQNQYDIYMYKIGYDAWSAKYWVEEMEQAFGQGVMEKVIQGKKTLSGSMKSLGADLDAKLIVYNDHPIDKWCLFNTAVDIDRNDNIQPAKTSIPTRRIDGTAALLDAYVIYQTYLNDYLTMI